MDERDRRLWVFGKLRLDIRNLQISSITRFPLRLCRTTNPISYWQADYQDVTKMMQWVLRYLHGKYHMIITCVSNMISRLKNGFSRQTNPRKLFHLILEDWSVKTIALQLCTCDDENKIKWPIISVHIMAHSKQLSSKGCQRTYFEGEAHTIEILLDASRWKHPNDHLAVFGLRGGSN